MYISLSICLDQFFSMYSSLSTSASGPSLSFLFSPSLFLFFILFNPLIDLNRMVGRCVCVCVHRINYLHSGRAFTFSQFLIDATRRFAVIIYTDRKSLPTRITHQYHQYTQTHFQGFNNTHTRTHIDKCASTASVAFYS